MAESARNASECSSGKALMDDSQLADCQCDKDGSDEDSTMIECAVCLQVCVHPVQLPCGHIFCFLCVKGVANQSKRCAMCRKELPADYLERPNLVGGVAVLDSPSVAFEDGNQWFYEGHNGWWQYDERTSAELETAFKKGEGACELLIAGFLYVIDFQAMVQFRRNDPSRRRRIKRDLVSIPKKGIAGLRVVSCQATPHDDRGDVAEGGEAGDGQVVPSIDNAQAALSELVLPSTNASSSSRPKSPSPVPVAPNNTPQTPHTPSQDSGTSSPTVPCDSSLHQIVQEMEDLLLLDSGDDDDDDDADLSPPHYSTFSHHLLD